MSKIVPQVCLNNIESKAIGMGKGNLTASCLQNQAIQSTQSLNKQRE
jgi:hypothetical protein